MARKIAYWIALALLAFTGVMGIYNGVTEWRDATNFFQQSVTGGVFAYGILGILTVYASLSRQPWVMRSAIGWAVAVSYVPGAAVMAYDERSTFGSAIAASVGGALIAMFVLWAIRPRALPDRSLPDL